MLATVFLASLFWIVVLLWMSGFWYWRERKREWAYAVILRENDGLKAFVLNLREQLVDMKRALTVQAMKEGDDA